MLKVLLCFSKLLNHFYWNRTNRDKRTEVLCPGIKVMELSEASLSFFAVVNLFSLNLYSVNSERINIITVKGCFPSTHILKVTKFSFKEQLLRFICTTFTNKDMMNLYYF